MIGVFLQNAKSILMLIQQVNSSPPANGVGFNGGHCEKTETTQTHRWLFASNHTLGVALLHAMPPEFYFPSFRSGRHVIASLHCDFVCVMVTFS